MNGRKKAAILLLVMTVVALGGEGCRQQSAEYVDAAPTPRPDARPAKAVPPGIKKGIPGFPGASPVSAGSGEPKKAM